MSLFLFSVLKGLKYPVLNRSKQAAPFAGWTGLRTTILDSDRVVIMAVVDGVDECILCWSYEKFGELIELMMNQRDEMWRMRSSQAEPPALVLWPGRDHAQNRQDIREPDETAAVYRRPRATVRKEAANRDHGHARPKTR
jgi:hypothetical protein